MEYGLVTDNAQHLGDQCSKLGSVLIKKRRVDVEENQSIH